MFKKSRIIYRFFPPEAVKKWIFEYFAKNVVKKKGER